MTTSSLIRLPGLYYNCRPLLSLPISCSPTQLAPWRRLARTEAFEASIDPSELTEARKWQQSVSKDSMPKGTTTYARSSGPGGQHVNK